MPSPGAMCLTRRWVQQAAPYAWGGRQEPPHAQRRIYSEPDPRDFSRKVGIFPAFRRFPLPKPPLPRLLPLLWLRRGLIFFDSFRKTT